jgi:hypothetical protein
VAQGVGTEFKFQYRKKKKNRGPYSIGVYILVWEDTNTHTPKSTKNKPK